VLGDDRSPCDYKFQDDSTLHLVAPQPIRVLVCEHLNKNWQAMNFACGTTRPLPSLRDAVMEKLQLRLPTPDVFSVCDLRSLLEGGPAVRSQVLIYDAVLRAPT
jgi:hypothetical protein